MTKTVTAASSTTLSWEHRSFQELVRLSWPITLSMLSYSTMTLVDTLLVGRLGPGPLAGVGLAGTLAFALLCFSIGMLRGTKTLVAQVVGAGQHREVGGHLAAALVVALGLGVLTAGLGQGVAELLPWLSATPTAGEAGRTYLRIRSLAAPLALIHVALREVRYGQGDARSPMVAALLANLLNISLAVLFVLKLRWGVAGAAWAAVIAQHAETGLLALVQSRAGGFSLRGLSRDHLRALWRIGLPTGLQFILEIGSFTLLAALIARLSEIEMAAHQIALQVIHFSFLPTVAIGEAVNVMAGQAVGADRDDLVGPASRQGLLLTGLYTGACTLVFALLAGNIVAGFTDAPALAVVAVRLLHVAAVFQIFDGANMIARSALRGAGDVHFAAVVGVVTSWAATPPLTWLLGYRLGLGALGGWLGLCCEIIVGALILWWRLLRGGWVPAAQASRAALA